MTRVWYLVPLPAWTLLVWGTRLRNIATDDDLSGAALGASIGIAVLFCLGALVVAAVAWRARSRAPRRPELLAVLGFALWTVGYWLVRATAIWLDDHSAGFKLVHTALAVASGLLAWLAARGTALESPRTRIAG